MKNHLKMHLTHYVHFIIAMVMVMITLSISCTGKRGDRIYYIDELNMFVSIEPIHHYDDGTGLFRIRLSESKNFENKDYIEIRRLVTDTPGVIFIFPANDKRYIYLWNRDNDVRRIVSDKYKFKLMTTRHIYDEKINSLRKWKSFQEYSDTTDSVIKLEQSITIQVGAYMNSLDKWVDSEWKGSVPVYETRESKDKASGINISDD